MKRTKGICNKRVKGKGALPVGGGLEVWCSGGLKAEWGVQARNI